MSRVYGGKKGYEFNRQKCTGCGRDVAVSMDPDGRSVWVRRHKMFGAAVGWCTEPRKQPRQE